MGLAACGGTDSKSTTETQTESTQKTASGKEEQKEEQKEVLGIWNNLSTNKQETVMSRVRGLRK